VDMEIVWSIAKHKLPSLKNEILKVDV